jgi:hypothetical protein
MRDVAGSLGKFFFIAGFVPALAFCVAVDLVILPPLLGGQHLVNLELFGIPGLLYVLGGILLGFLLLALNTPIIKLYENGFYVSGWLKKRNRDRCLERYTALMARREAYQQAAEQDRELEAAIAKLEAVHKKLESLETAQRLPHYPEVVMPTDLGNAYAVMEEYPYERYGMDAMVYWPRLSGVLSDEYRAQIADLKTTADFSLNFSLLSGLFGLGSLAVGSWVPGVWELVCGVLALVAAYGLYRSAVGSTRELGEAVMSSFDLFRGTLLESYGWPKPDSLSAERRLWLLLASFIRRGEEFYFPLEPTAGDHPAFLRQELVLHMDNLATLRQQAAIFAAGEKPLYLLNQIKAEEQAIGDIKAKLTSPDG